MRKGDNISRDKFLELTPCEHRVIIPLYIPKEEGYFKDSFEIFKMCLISVRKTAASTIKVSVVSNGSCNEVNTKLFKLQCENYIDELIIETEKIGKLNSILKALRTAEEHFITITDADVLFLNGWDVEIFNIFNSFKKAAAVSPLPVFRTQNHYTSNILFDYLFSNRIGFSRVKNPMALERFAKSIGWECLEQKWKDFIMTIKNEDGNKAVVGCSHAVVTYKKEIFKSAPKGNSKYQLGGDSEGLYLDQIAQYHDGYRLATFDNFAYHLGNNLEDWMILEFQSLNAESKTIDVPILPILKRFRFVHFIKNVVFKKLISRKFLRAYYYKMKGLKKDKIQHFLG